jgi:hypothetical protein
MKSQKLRDSARGQDCTFQIVDVCNGDSNTTVLCHLPDESHGMAKKADDFCAGFGCSSCHADIDNVSRSTEYANHAAFYNNRANRRTIRKWLEMGLIKIAGAK